MSLFNILYPMARADFLERVRRYSFLITLGLVIFLGYQVNTGVVAVYLDQYRGVFNSAWAGSTLTVVGTFFLGWFGFYLVKGSIARDYETGVGQIVATTPLTRAQYMLAKWLSNLVVLMLMMAILAAAGFLMQLIQREDPRIDLWALLSPFLIVGLPAMALVAGMATLFDTISWLRGGFGNLVYFFLFTLTPALAFESIAIPAAVEPLGLKLFSEMMGLAARQAFPAYSGGFSIGSTDRVVIGTFVWPGVSWTVEIILWRLAIVALALGCVLLASLLFDRFDSSKVRKRRPAGPELVVQVSQSEQLDRPAPPKQISLSAVKPGFRFAGLFLSEIRLLLKGQPWWWYAVAVVLIGVGLFNPAETVRKTVLMLTWIWPLLIWSNIGVRESRFGTGQMVFSAYRPLTRQLPAAWLAGVAVTALTGLGAGMRFLLNADIQSLAIWLAAVIFIPSFALAAGIWSGTSKLFEVLYVLLWYLGPANHIRPFDFLATDEPGRPLLWLAVGIVLLLSAIAGRQRQIRAG